MVKLYLSNRKRIISHKTEDLLIVHRNNPIKKYTSYMLLIDHHWIPEKLLRMVYESINLKK